MIYLVIITFQSVQQYLSQCLLYAKHTFDTRKIAVNKTDSGFMVLNIIQWNETDNELVNVH